MDRSFRLFLLAAVVVCATAQAHSPAELKANFQSLTPSGKKARAAWQWGPAVNGLPTAVYGVDSDSGIVRRITPESPLIEPIHPNVTGDGQRVVFWDRRSGKTMMINFDGTGGYKTICQEGEFFDYWYDSANKAHWAVIWDGFGWDVGRINIDDLTRKVAVFSGISGVDYNGDDGCGFDGEYVCGYFNGRPGVAKSPSGPTCVQASGDGGCEVQIAPDGSHDFMHQYDAHQAVDYMKFCASGSGTSPYTRINTIDAPYAKVGNNSCGWGGDPADHTRFTNLKDYITLWGGGKAENPFLLRLSDPGKFMTMMHTNCEFAGQMDVVFYTPGPTRVADVAARPSRFSGRGDRGVEEFSLDGSRLGVASARSSRSVVIRWCRGDRAEVKPTLMGW